MPPVPTKPQPSRPERIAVNLKDLDRVNPSLRAQLLKGRLDLTRAVSPGDDVKDAAVAFSCDLLTAACVVDTLRSHDRDVGDPPTRACVQRAPGLGWTKLPGELQLTKVVAGQVILNPTAFPPMVRARDLAVPRVKSVKM